ncbi:hypothetical protein COCC4DRAFT_30561 [Bipolaris maydis ATCC 48331]|uniref:Uncharacterized protein n=2 Tax=Cochliobolus heterostrophus TaxID=5016 RepID=M2UTV9_COCH5|nr:uncharacterized protein COCC4DRAFT_30561 [Bipolaris maydis ATCC 48331]EMD91288.1 hypothetical protein COCHEDRAFT_1021377 [Bipolaris maydis C5]ENI08954.1 hypothetical protein COCC4DRAFT_30561 [Bipolaris maydis ATCC 48331]
MTATSTASPATAPTAMPTMTCVGTGETPLLYSGANKGCVAGEPVMLVASAVVVSSAERETDISVDDTEAMALGSAVYTAYVTQ